MGFGSGGGGNSSIAGSTDTALNNPTNNEVLTYDGGLSMWKNATAAVQDTGMVVVKWNGTSWGAYSTDPNTVRMFMSQNDVEAEAPTYYSEFDLWYAHPEAE